MIGSLRGRLLDRHRDEVLVEVGGIGYRVAVTPATMVDLGGPDGEVFLHVHHHRREDAELLFGFGSVEDRRVFEVLIGTHGVGPSLAMAILSVHRPDVLRHVVATDDVAALCQVPGVGKKTAARLLVELKSRLAVPEQGDPRPGAAGSSPAAATHADVREALAALGYDGEEVTRVVADLPDDGETAELLRLALRRLAVA